MLIDPATPPAANGQPIPKDEKNIHTTETTIKIPSSVLPSGEHTIWVVLGNKTQTLKELSPEVITDLVGLGAIWRAPEEIMPSENQRSRQ